MLADLLPRKGNASSSFKNSTSIRISPRNFLDCFKASFSDYHPGESKKVLTV